MIAAAAMSFSSVSVIAKRAAAAESFDIEDLIARSLNPRVSSLEPIRGSVRRQQSL